MKLQVLKKGKHWYWRIKSKGRILAHSEQYSSRWKALSTASSVMKTKFELQVLPPGVEDVKLPKNWGKIK